MVVIVMLSVQVLDTVLIFISEDNLMDSRYKLYGVKPAEHANNNDDTNPKDQVLHNAVVVYETDDKDEAMKLVREGGFVSEKDGYIAVQGAKDTINGGTVGIVPAGV